MELAVASALGFEIEDLLHCFQKRELRDGESASSSYNVFCFCAERSEVFDATIKLREKQVSSAAHPLGEDDPQTHL